jgi:hypothetical protein
MDTIIQATLRLLNSVYDESLVDNLYELIDVTSDTASTLADIDNAWLMDWWTRRPGRGVEEVWKTRTNEDARRGVEDMW